MLGIDIRADVGFRIAFVLTLCPLLVRVESKWCKSILVLDAFLDTCKARGSRMQEGMHMRESIKRKF